MSVFPLLHTLPILHNILRLPQSVHFNTQLKVVLLLYIYCVLWSEEQLSIFGFIGATDVKGYFAGGG